MDLQDAVPFCRRILIQDGKEKVRLPDWAIAEIWLGWWCRKLQLAQDRLLVVAVLPARDMSAPFAGLGCLFAGVEQFRGGLTWDEFCALPPGVAVFWKTLSNNTRHGGVILDTNPSFPEMVQIRITSGKKRVVETTWGISIQTFEQHIFSEENLPTPRRTDVLESVIQFHRELGLATDNRWVSTAGAEAQIVTNQARFRKSLQGLEIGAQDSTTIRVEEALCAAKPGDSGLTKLHVVSSVQQSAKLIPVTILDGRGAFDQVDQIESGNVLILLERSEYTAEVDNFLLELRNVAASLPGDVVQGIPSAFPAGMELCAFAVPKGQ